MQGKIKRGRLINSAEYTYIVDIYRRRGRMILEWKEGKTTKRIRYNDQDKIWNIIWTNV